MDLAGPRALVLDLAHPRAVAVVRSLARAGVEDLARVKGINRKLAQLIYDAFHDG